MYFYSDECLLAATQEFNIAMHRDLFHTSEGLCAPVRHHMTGRAESMVHAFEGWTVYPGLMRWGVDVNRLIQIHGIDEALPIGDPIHMAMCHGNNRFMGNLYPTDMRAEYPMHLRGDHVPAIQISANFVGCGALTIL
jgi:hypothetical protein